MRNITTVIAASLMLAACASNPSTAPMQSSEAEKAKPAQAVSQPAPVAAAPAPAPAAQAAVPSQADVEAQRLAEARKLADQLKGMDQKSVYFDFDKSLIKPEYQDTVQQQVEWMKSHKNDVVTLEGNADERGSNEYNLALGMRRATTVEKVLELAGIPSSRIKDVSYGEEKPRLICHEEKCWHENRRVDFDHKLN